MTVTGTNIDAPDANALADFYRRLLGWETGTDEPGWVVLRAPGGGHTLNFQTEERYVPPVWPAGPGDQQMMMHLEIAVDDLEAGVGARRGAGRDARLVPAAGRRPGLPRPGRASLLFVSGIGEPEGVRVPCGVAR